MISLNFAQQELRTYAGFAAANNGARSLFTVLCLLFTVYCVTGCSKREAALTNGDIRPPAQLPSGFAGDTAYAVVRADALPALYENFSSVLSSQGLVKWDGRYDCNHFAALYVALSQTKFTVAAWHSETKAQTLALCEVWYLQGGQPGKGHAVVGAMTESGMIYIEPQNGQQVALTQSEINSVFLRKW